MNFVPIKFGKSNLTPLATLTSSRAPTTSIDNLKTEFRSRPVVFGTPSSSFSITGTFADYQYINYFSLPGTNLDPETYVQLELFDTTTSDPDLLGMTALPVYDLLPLGEWRAGIDAYGSDLNATERSALTVWLSSYYKCKVFRLTITANPATDNADLRLRTFHIGESLRLEHNFDYGLSINFMTEPELVRTSSGSYFPKRAQRESRAMSLDLSYATDNDRAILAKFERRLQGRPFIVSAYPDRRGWQLNEYTYLARFANALSYTHVYEDIHSIPSIQIIEV